MNKYKNTEKYIITFRNKNGDSFFINNNFKFIPITNETSCDEIKNNTKWFTQKGAKMISKKLWNNRNLNVKASQYCTFEYLISKSYLCTTICKTR